MDVGLHERIILLNRLISRSSTRAPQEHRPPLHAGEELLGIIVGRAQKGVCREFFEVDAEREREITDDKARIAANSGKSFIHAAKVNVTDAGPWRYVTFLVEYVDTRVKSFAVVDIEKLEGRDLSGAETERGSFSAHVVVRVPIGDVYDDGAYRCAVESVSNLSRRKIEYLFDRQLRRYAHEVGMSFTVITSGRKGKERSQDYMYRPKLQLLADVGRSLFGGEKKGEPSLLVFTNRAEKVGIAEPPAVSHEDVFGTVEVRISAKQGPDNPEEKRSWVARLKAYYQSLGYETKMYFRHVKGEKQSGKVHPAVDDAADLLMCPRESIFTRGEPRKWVKQISTEVSDRMKELLDRDELWQLKK